MASWDWAPRSGVAVGFLSVDMSTDIDEPVAVGATSLVSAGAPDRGEVSSLPVEPLPPLLASDDDTEEGEDVGLATSTAGIVARFSTLAGISLFLLVIAGTFMAWKELGSFSALWSTAYGRAILIKIGIVVVIIVGRGLQPIPTRCPASRPTSWRNTTRPDGPQPSATNGRRGGT